MVAFYPSHKSGNPTFDCDVSCPQCEERFKLNRVGLEAKEFILCFRGQRVIEVDLEHLEERAIRVERDPSG